MAVTAAGVLGGRYALAGKPLLTKERMEELAGSARAAGIDCVHWSGPTRLRTDGA